MPDCLHPSHALLSKIGSIIIHMEELSSPDGHLFDVTVLKVLWDDSEVREWMAGMRALALLPVKRNPGAQRKGRA